MADCEPNRPAGNLTHDRPRSTWTVPETVRPFLAGASLTCAGGHGRPGVDFQIGRDHDRRRNDSDATVGFGSGGVTVGPTGKTAAW
jgi:hypothetical protein